LALLFLAGAGEEKVLAIVDTQGATPGLMRFLGSWTVRFLKNPFEVLTEIYRMIRTTEVSA